MKNQSADGLRGLAAFNVAVSHFVAAFLPMMLHGNYPGIFSENKNPSVLFKFLTSPVVSIFYNGHFAVLLFFVLSGYVLTIPYFQEKIDFAETLKKRLWGRYFRLNFPIAFVILISYTFYKLSLYSNIQAADISGSVNWLRNFYPQGIPLGVAIKEALYESIFFGRGTFCPPLWTLKIEFIGSIYLLLFYISKPLSITLTPLLMSFFLIYEVHQQDSIFYYAIFLGSLLTGSVV